MDKLPRLNADKVKVIADAAEKLMRWGVPRDHKEVRFLQDMIGRIARKKSLSVRQKSWILSIVNREEPDREVLDRLDKILSEHAVFDLHDMISSFRLRVLSGGELTEKQMKALERCEDDLSRALSGERFSLSEEQHEILGYCRAMYYAKLMYFNHRPSTQKMVDSILTQWYEKQRITEKQYEAVYKVFKNMLKPVFEPDYPSGSMAKVPTGTAVYKGDPSANYWNPQGKPSGNVWRVEEDMMGLAMANPIVTTSGAIKQKFLVGTDLVYVEVKHLRRPWRKNSKI